MNKISIIIPVLNEENALWNNLPLLQNYRELGHEVIVVDGGSTDASIATALPLVDLVLQSPPGRSTQMNTGATRASGDVLLFLHIDSLLPENALQQLLFSLTESGRCWGRFDVRLSGQQLLYRLIGGLMNLRSRVSGVATGDQAIFVCAKAFKAVGSYPAIPLMEDIALSKALRRLCWPLCLRQQVIVSSRRWEQHGVFRTVLLMWWLRLLYVLGVSPARLHARYYRKHP